MSDSHWHELRQSVKEWAKIVSQVEHGYAFSFDDYLNDLDLRRTLDESVQFLERVRPGAIPESLTAALAATDERFRQVTVPSAENVWGVENERDSGWSVERQWYYYRLPEKLPASW